MLFLIGESCGELEMSIASCSSPSAGKGEIISITIELSPWSAGAQPKQFVFIALVSALIATSFTVQGYAYLEVSCSRLSDSRS